MEKTVIKNIENKIIKSIDILNRRGVIVYPFGEVGHIVKDILDKNYSLEKIIYVDLYPKEDFVKPFDFMKQIEHKKYIVLIASNHMKYYHEIRNNIYEIFPEDNVIDLFEYENIGKCSYGPLAKPHFLVESVGAFCSFAEGCDVVLNHPTEFVSTHPFMYLEPDEKDHSNRKNWEAYLPRINCQYFRNDNKTRIGNDVWLGRNVIIINGVNIGNGVIAGAGAVITKDVPDYAVVAGIPATIIKYRFSEEQIRKLNKIAWWNWSREKIAQNYEDFYNVDTFIDKYYRDGE